MAEAIGALSSFTVLLSLTIDTVKAIDHIRKRKLEFDELRKQLVTISQYLLKLQNTSADLAWHERIVVKPHLDLTLRSLSEDVSAIKRLASRVSRRETGASSFAPFMASRDPSEFYLLRKSSSKLSRYEKEFRIWAKSTQIMTRTSNLKLLVPSDPGQSGSILAGFKEDTSSKVLQWLSSMDQRERHQELQRHQIEDTGQWFLQCYEYVSWRDSEAAGVLWVKGVAGSGKTFLASHVINDLSKGTTHNNSRLSYAYCDFRVRSTFTEICASLVRQVLSADRDTNIPSIARELFNDHNESRPPSLSDLARIYLEAVSMPDVVYVVIDALDEVSPCTELEIATLSNVLQRSNTKILIFSRNAPPSRHKEFLHLPVHKVECPISPNKDDLKRVLIKRLKGQIKDSKVEELIDCLAAKENGSFVSSIYLLDEILHNKYTLKDIRDALQTQLNDQKSHQNALSSIIDRVFRQQDDYLSELASHTLMWLCHAKRPITAEEVCEAFAIRRSKGYLSMEMIPNAAFVTKSCMGLIITDSFSNITVTHSAIVVELRRRTEQYKQGQLQVSHDCLKYLTLQDIASHSPSEDDWKVHPFLSYARENWIFHLQDIKATHEVDADPSLLTVLKVIQESALVQSSVNDGSSPTPGFKQAMILPKQLLAGLSQLHICARFNLVKEADALIKEGMLVDDLFRNKWKTTPFHEAARSGNEAFLNLLTTAHYPWKEDIDGRLATHYASYYGHDKFLELFCEKFPEAINKQDYTGETPLMVAATLGHERIVKILLDLGARTEPTDSKSNTALHLATINGHHTVSMMLIESGADTTVKNAAGNTLLHCAVLGRSAHLVRVFLLKGVDLNAQNTNGQSALHTAAGKAESLAISRLIARGADVNLLTREHKTPLMEAVSSGHEQIVRELVDRGANLEKSSIPQAVDFNGLLTSGHISRTALNLAAEEGHTQIVRILLDAGAVVDRGGEEEIPPLCFASFNNHLEIAKLLVQHGADINERTRDNLTPLHFAARKGHTAMVRFLINCGADVNVMASGNKTSLYFAVESGNLSAIQLLHEHGARAPSTIKSIAERSGNEALSQIVQECETSMWTVSDSPYDPLDSKYDDEVHISYTGAAFDSIGKFNPSLDMEVDSTYVSPVLGGRQQLIESKRPYFINRTQVGHQATKRTEYKS